MNAYNREPEIGETLESILSQTVMPREIIVVDDGSTDRTAEVIAQFSKHVTYFRIDNSGPGISRHAAVSRCRHEWIATCDSDDLWEEDHLEQIGETIESFPGTVLAFSNTSRFGSGEDGNYNHFDTISANWWDKAIINKKGERWCFGADAYLSLLERNPVYPSCSVFNSSVYSRIGGAKPQLSRITSEDSDLTRRFALAGTVSCNANPTVRIRKHTSNFSEAISSNLLGKHLILERHLRELDLPPEYVNAVKKERDISLSRAFRHAYWERDLDRAQDCRQRMQKHQFTLRDRLRLLRLSWFRGKV